MAPTLARRQRMRAAPVEAAKLALCKHGCTAAWEQCLVHIMLLRSRLWERICGSLTPPAGQDCMCSSACRPHTQYLAKPGLVRSHCLPCAQGGAPALCVLHAMV